LTTDCRPSNVRGPSVVPGRTIRRAQNDDGAADSHGESRVPRILAQWTGDRARAPLVDLESYRSPCLPFTRAGPLTLGPQYALNSSIILGVHSGRFRPASISVRATSCAHSSTMRTLGLVGHLFGNLRRMKVTPRDRSPRHRPHTVTPPMRIGTLMPASVVLRSAEGWNRGRRFENPRFPGCRFTSRWSRPPPAPSRS